MRFVSHECEAARQHATIAHRAKELLLGNKIGAQALQAFVISARHARGEGRKRLLSFAAPHGQQRRLAGEHPAHSLR